jgi:hypothetical protein
MKIDVHSHLIEEIFFDALKSLPGVTVQVKPDRFSYLLKDGKTWLPFRPEMFDPDHLIREMDRKCIDISILSMNTPSVYIFEEHQRVDLARRLNDAVAKRTQRKAARHHAAHGARLQESGQLSKAQISKIQASQV